MGEDRQVSCFERAVYLSTFHDWTLTPLSRVGAMLAIALAATTTSTRKTS
jgi:hypothetical protein